jgi:MoaA/NifB/PqqE/SkfB family radical SAM enzyme
MIKNVRLIEIEIHSYCNRTCWFCPNSFLDRKHKIEMKEWVYLKILQELKDMKYKEVISFSRYNEPLSDMNLFVKRLKQAK